MAVLAPWVTGFDPRFIALTGSDSTIQAAQLAAGLLTAQRDTVSAVPAADYLVGPRLAGDRAHARRTRPGAVSVRDQAAGLGA